MARTNERECSHLPRSDHSEKLLSSCHGERAILPAVFSPSKPAQSKKSRCHSAVNFKTDDDRLAFEEHGHLEVVIHHRVNVVVRSSDYRRH